ncbi:hypothetical protein ES703_42803 [subsurface metagenome]
MVELFERALEAFAVGDALGMPTEFMTHEAIKSKFGLVEKLLDPSVSPIHPNLKKGQITDDTEQNLYLIETYYRSCSLPTHNTNIGASSGERIRYFLKGMKILKSTEEALSFIYNVVGTSMESNEVVPASIAVFAYAREDVWLSLKMGASCGGDTDTIAAIAGLLSSILRRRAKHSTGDRFRGCKGEHS